MMVGPPVYRTTYEKVWTLESPASPEALAAAIGAAGREMVDVGRARTEDQGEAEAEIRPSRDGQTIEVSVRLRTEDSTDDPRTRPVAVESTTARERAREEPRG
jgi:hypothetical protein